MFILNAFNTDEFLQKFWQKKPVVIRNAFVNFTDPLDEHDLAGLAQEEGIDSRIISCEQGNWKLAHGPFEDFTEHCQHKWSLLVQSVNAYIDSADELIGAFDFIPVWRTDDLMVSFSVAGGGVGPHLDQYDVFIVQGKGSRRWKVGSRGNYETKSPHPEIQQIPAFSPIIDQVLQTGDLIYIPPGFPHEGTALEDCLNYSVGFRAPEQNELLSAFADHVIDKQCFNKRYTDKDLAARSNPSEIKQQEVHEFRKLMTEMIDSAHFETWLKSFLSRGASPADSQIEPENFYAIKDVEEMIKQKHHFIRGLGLKPVMSENGLAENKQVAVFINEIQFNVPADQLSLVRKLLNQPVWQSYSEINDENCMFFAQFMTTLLNAGLWYPE